MKIIKNLLITLVISAAGLLSAQAQNLEDETMLKKFVQWHLGFTTNVQQRDKDLAAKAEPRWGLSELRFQRIWHKRNDGYWIYYETSQPDVRPDRNQIWHLYRNDFGNLKVDLYSFKNIKHGLSFWGKGDDPEAFETIKMDELSTVAGCNATYHWIPEFARFSGVNTHQKCFTIGKSYLLQHVEISKMKDGTLVRNDWHSFYDENGVAKQGAKFKRGDQGPTIHLYTETYDLN
ncbi:CpcT/CpeT family chromophore lyase [Aliiglaciecola sp. 3_MG-2023]|uniref:CpcT/CpeT family chromophore lyase n=1 Tax=Aliiglaciecola sp. 3_MG-2023 TaxID=3062644 RepID=UPI0026E41A51|nr:CpcT/CpeT family chromophore lyase [Aliiglaciecola sp. 3_MG-2023]MDO6695078.1 CpcT/CpeT family chromophore lyase [Aliiglaciecola sp. 3_MG-2023]